MYNSGRLVTYSLIGLVFGLLGKGLFIAELQQAASIFIGLGFLLVAALSLNVEQHLLKSTIISTAYFKLKGGLGKLLKTPTRYSLFSIGLLNGFLPCGLVYMALIGALSTGSAINGMFYMALFGLGTFPLMMLAGFSGHLVSLRLRQTFKKVYPVFLVGFAILFLLRGFQFDLPRGIELWETLGDVPMCQ
jgi:sulfite exporter TauE/SafE